ncbi:helix-turn-helix transcriptional regulator [Zobellella sp. DQSA1]|uniref:helix-turn-helix transcriptional regulator n=1 Tax=Zobellella sp. DQSA1 TaxID=3342386 RepID=UPI0035BF18EC
MRYRIAAEEAGPGPARGVNGWEEYRLPAEVGECYFERYRVEPGFSLVRSRYRPHHDLVESSRQQEEQRTLIITLGLCGDSLYRADSGERLLFRRGQTTVASVRASQGERCFKAGELTRQLRLIVTQGALDTYLGQGRGEQLLGSCAGRDGALRQLAFYPCPASVNRHLEVLDDAELGSRGGDLELKIHALSLLSAQLQRLRVQAGDKPRLAPAEVARVEQAQDIMCEEMDQPLTIAYLCARVALSEYKLKEGFRRLYGTSPYRRLTALRMQRARELLAGGWQVAQVAYRVGYAHPGNFSAAFTGFFGRSPKSVAGER